MKKIQISLFYIFIMLGLTSCTQKTVYFTSEFSGYIYDSKTKQPLKNKIGYIIADDIGSDFDTKLDANGKFIIPAKTQKYYYSRPSVQRYLRGSGDLFFSFPDYHTKRVEYVEYYVAQVPEERTGFDHFNTVNMGIIYLDPK